MCVSALDRRAAGFPGGAVRHGSQAISPALMLELRPRWSGLGAARVTRLTWPALRAAVVHSSENTPPAAPRAGRVTSAAHFTEENCKSDILLGLATWGGRCLVWVGLDETRRRSAVTSQLTTHCVRLLTERTSCIPAPTPSLNRKAVQNCQLDGNSQIRQPRKISSSRMCAAPSLPTFL